MEEGINSDRYKAWRSGSQSEIGNVHLAFRVILQALSDFFHGSPEEMVSAALFFYGDDTQSTYNLWCRVLGQKGGDFAECLELYRKTGEMPSGESFRELEKLYNSMTQ